MVHNHKYIKQQNLFFFYMDTNRKHKKKIEQQIIILEWFLKDHMTLNTGVMAATNLSFYFGRNSFGDLKSMTETVVFN